MAPEPDIISLCLDPKSSSVSVLKASATLLAVLEAEGVRWTLL